MAAKKMSLEECFESLDDIILELQSGELSLEDSFKKYEDGMKLIKKCNETIDKVEKKLTVVETDDETVMYILKVRQILEGIEQSIKL